MTMRKLFFLLPLLVLLLAPGAGVSTVQAGLGAPWWSDLAWNADGSLLAGVGPGEGLVLLLDPDLTPFAAADAVSLSFYYGKAAWSPDGARLAVKEAPYGYYPETNERYVLSVWSAESLILSDRLLSGSGFKRQPMELVWQPDGEAVITEVGGRLQRVDAMTMAPTPVGITLPEYEELRYLSFSPDSAHAAYLVANSSQDTVWMYGFDVTTSTLEWELDLDEQVNWVFLDPYGVPPVVGPLDIMAWSNDGRIAIGGYFLALYTPADDSLQLLNASSETLMHHVEWSPDGRYLAVSTGKRVEIWDPASAERVEVVYSNPETSLHRDPYALAWHPDGTRLVVSLIIDRELLSFDVSHLFGDA